MVIASPFWETYNYSHLKVNILKLLWLNINFNSVLRHASNQIAAKQLPKIFRNLVSPSIIPDSPLAFML